jgi:hypothetical protein
MSQASARPDHATPWALHLKACDGTESIFYRQPEDVKWGAPFDPVSSFLATAAFFSQRRQVKTGERKSTGLHKDHLT